MLQYMTGLSYLDISSFDFSVATNISSFLYATGPTIRDFHFPQDLSTATITGSGFNYAFGSLLSIEELDVSAINLNITNAEYTFRYNYSMEKCILPESLHGIGVYCFEQCRNLKTLVMPSTTLVTLSNTNAFSGCNRAKTIYVPDNLVS